MHDSMAPSFVANALPPGAAAYLVPGNPILTDLKSRYARHAPFAHSQWSPSVLRRELDLRYFRGDNIYNWQIRGGVEQSHYRLMAEYARGIDRLGLWERLTEDALFGAYTFEDGTAEDGTARRVSRDLLDSIIQINFLERHARLSGLPQPSLLDIGAGYGRLAWRLVTAMPGMARIWCADAVAESTFLCDYYLRFRGAGPAAHVLPFDEAAAALRGQRIDIATAIHSLSECTAEAIGWWLTLLDTTSLAWLLVIPNTMDRLLTMEADGSRLEFQPLIEAHGYRLIVKDNLLAGAPDLQQACSYMSTECWLFRRE